MEHSTQASDGCFVLVVGVDLMDTDSSGYALNQAAKLAMRIPGSEMHVIYAIPPDRSPSVQETAAQLKRYIMAKATEVGGLARTSVGVHLRRGDAAQAIAQLASDVRADAIVVGRHKPFHLKDLIVGSTASRLMAATSGPVFIAGPRPSPQESHVISIEPACPDCVQARAASKGQTWWCARHSQPHLPHRRHHYSYQSELPFAERDVEVTP